MRGSPLVTRGPFVVIRGLDPRVHWMPVASLA